MAITPHDWSVVVIGFWNRAILTPSGVVRRLFHLPEQTPVEVEVALDAFVPFRIKHDNVIVTPGSDKLHVQPASFNFQTLAGAMKVARVGLEALPETPIFAAGYNLNFKTSEHVAALAPITDHPWDDRLSDQDFQIETRATARSLIWRGGRIKVGVSQEVDMSFTVALNFDRRSNSVPELVEWLSMPIQDIQDATERILTRCIDLAVEDIRYAD